MCVILLGGLGVVVTVVVVVDPIRLDGLVRFWQANGLARTVGPGSGRTQPARYRFAHF